jgi:hypothetical protein
MLKKYFGADTFAIIGNSLNMQVRSADAQKFDLVLRYNVDDAIKDVIAEDFVIRQSDLGLTQIEDCFILLREGKTMTPVTRVTLCFINEQNLHREFAAWLNAMKMQKSRTSEQRTELRQYCRDVYGVTDNNNLNDVISRFLKQ